MQQLQQEVMRLNGKVEEQAHELRYAQGAEPAALYRPGQAYGRGHSLRLLRVSRLQATVRRSRPASGGSAPQAGEAEAYRAAYALVQGRQFEQAIPAFKQFLQRYPDGQYAANAHYWLGELYLVVDPPDLESARQSFACC